jgi:ferredoxin, 2Fe-2S
MQEMVNLRLMKTLGGTITFLPYKITVPFSGHPSVLEVAVANNIPLNHSCGGMGSCTTCRLFVRVGLNKLPARNELEQEHATNRSFLPEERLGCQTSAIDGLAVEVPFDES